MLIRSENGRLRIAVLIFLGYVAITRCTIPQCFSQDTSVFIDENCSGIDPNPVQLNQTTSLRICVENIGQQDLFCSIRILSEQACVDVFPVSEQNVTIFAQKRSYFYFSTRSNETGIFPIEVELRFQNNQTDFHILNLQVTDKKEMDLISYEFRVSFAYFFSFFTIVIVYFAWFWKKGEDNRTDNESTAMLWIMMVLCTIMWIVYAIDIYNGTLYAVLARLIAPSIGRIELIIALAFILSIVSWILMPRRLEYSVKLANILLFMITIPVVLDWLLIPNVPSPATLAGRIIWQLIEIVVAFFVGYFLDLVFSRKKQDLF